MTTEQSLDIHLTLPTTVLHINIYLCVFVFPQHGLDVVATSIVTNRFRA